MCSKCNNPKHTYQYKVGDKGKTRDGRPYEIIAVDAANLYSKDTVVGYVEVPHFPGKFAVCTWRVNGSYYDSHGGEDAWDLLPPEEVVYLNLYRTENGSVYGYVHSKLSEAQHTTFGQIPCGTTRIAEALRVSVPNTQE